MSLINDALRRAKEAQAKTPLPPLDNLPLRPVDPHAAVRRGIGLVLPVSLGLVALLILLFAWRYYQDRSPDKQTTFSVAAKTAPAKAVGTADTPLAPAAAALAPDSGPKTTSPASGPQTASPQPTSQPGAPAVAVDPAAGGSNSVVVSEPLPPQPAPLRLQGIIYSRAKPSAVISGKTLYLGDRIREYRVTAITADSVTLAGGGQTNVMTLSGD